MSQTARNAMIDVLGIGNAIVDVIARAEDDFLVSHGMVKGAMALIDEPRAQAIYDAMGPAVEVSGGSAANTMAGIANFGQRAAFVGRVRADSLGTAFTHDIRAAGVRFETSPATNGASTARCYLLVTPDGERTMNTYLGAAQDLHPGDIDPIQVAGAAITYLEGYLWDPKNAKDAFIKAADIAHQSSRKVALTLSDAFCVDRYRGEFLNLIRARTVDIVFANESELHALYETSDFDAALQQFQREAGLGIVTRGAKGCAIVEGNNLTMVPAFAVDEVVDTTGAGDLFAAGFLTGLSRGANHETCGRLGALAAAEVIQHVGARPQASLKALAEQHGLIEAA